MIGWWGNGRGYVPWRSIKILWVIIHVAKTLREGLTMESQSLVSHKK
jgi:hypothetical protein